MATGALLRLLKLELGVAETREVLASAVLAVAVGSTSSSRAAA